MKLFTRALTVSAGMAAVVALAAAPFEGHVDLAIHDDERGAPQTVRYALKGELVRVELKAAGQTMASLIDPGRRELLVLAPYLKMYTRMTLQQGMQTLAHTGALNPTMSIERPGRFETILGYRCSLVLVKNSEQVTELWLAEGLGSFKKIALAASALTGRGKTGFEARWDASLTSGDGFPLRVISRNAARQVVFKMEALKVTARSLPATHFSVPVDYQEFAFPNLGGFNFFR